MQSVPDERTMPYLIDGYNLLFSTGRLAARAGRGGLEAGRKWLVVELTRAHGPDLSGVTVVFDASGAPPGTPAPERPGGLRILFARGQTADDLIEDLIRAEREPRSLTVVSDDNRIKGAARRRGCAVLGCLDYCESWAQPRRAVAPVAAEPGKPERLSEAEKLHWLEAFGDVEDVE